MRKSLPAIIFLISIWIMILIPFQIIGHGFLPPDDAMRHSAKVISGKDWGQILVLRDDIKMDSHPGWHAILSVIYKITKCDTLTLVLFSVILLSALFCVTPLLFLRYQEAWLLSLLAVSLTSPTWLFRLFLGRPYIVTMAVLLVICLAWPKLKQKNINVPLALLLIIAIALSAWIHCGWYMFALPILALFIARQWKAGFLLTVYSAIGIAIGAVATGHPVLFFKQTILHLFLAYGTCDLQRMLVTEFRSVLCDINIVFMVALFLIWRSLRGKWNRSAIDDPVLILAAISFILGSVTARVWIDWGMPALMVWIANEFQSALEDRIAVDSLKRLGITVCICAALYLSVTNDANSRWSMTKPLDFISAEDKDQAGWVPEPGGVIYSDDMRIFYQTFFKNPTAPWRYILGFESALMPKEDLEVLRNIVRNFATPKCYQPWVSKMKRADRLIVRGGPDRAPKIEGLEWHYIALNTWSGRKPQK
jgi:hypothetical protein